MSRIEIRHAHALAPREARKVAEELAKTLAERFGIDYAWQGDVLNFSRPGVDGAIELGKTALTVQAKLGFLAAMFKDKIEAEIQRVLDERF